VFLFHPNQGYAHSQKLFSFLCPYFLPEFPGIARFISQSPSLSPVLSPLHLLSACRIFSVVQSFNSRIPRTMRTTAVMPMWMRYSTV
jgi:hypothetical protein